MPDFTCDDEIAMLRGHVADAVEAGRWEAARLRESLDAERAKVSDLQWELTKLRLELASARAWGSEIGASLTVVDEPPAPPPPPPRSELRMRCTHRKDEKR